MTESQWLLLLLLMPRIIRTERRDDDDDDDETALVTHRAVTGRCSCCLSVCPSVCSRSLHSVHLLGDNLRHGDRSHIGRDSQLNTFRTDSHSICIRPCSRLIITVVLHPSEALGSAHLPRPSCFRHRAVLLL